MDKRVKPWYSDEYILKKGIPYEEYQSMPEDEIKTKFPYGSFTFSGLTIATTLVHYQAILAHEDEMIAELMELEGLEVNYELREKFPNSHFDPICYDDAILGINPVTGSVIYDIIYHGYLATLFIEWIKPSYKDTMYRSTDTIRYVKDWANDLDTRRFDGKVPPTYILFRDKHFMKHWDDLQDPDWF